MDGPSAVEASGELSSVNVGPPLGLLAELTHRCPLQCPYCSNPVHLLKAAEELATESWVSAFSQAADLGVLQVHLSGGEPALRQDLEELIGFLAGRGVYSNLITAGVTLTHDRVKRLAVYGLDHVQISLQAVDSTLSDSIGNYKGSLAKKLAAARWVGAEGLPLTINAPTHRHNIGQTRAIIELAVELGAQRLEIAHVQYYGWARRNEAALLPPYEHVLEEAEIIAEAKEQLKGVLSIDYVTPDYYAQFPKPCMGGWGEDVITIAPDGKVLPCHAAQTLPMTFDNIKERPLREIWYEGEAFNRFRGFTWMKEPCRSCPRKEIDFGGCRCQAFAITGDAEATDPACSFSPHHDILPSRASSHSIAKSPPFVFRRIGAAVTAE